MTQHTPHTTLLSDYTPPPFLIDTVDVDIDFRSGEAIVTAQLALRRNPASHTPNAPLVLDGEEPELLGISLDGVELAPDRYRLSPSQLTLADVPDAFHLETRTRIHPDGNTRLSGLYRSANGYFTQCEAQGFRRITWFQDRPDVMARYTVTLHADKAELPQLLANGNPARGGDEAGGRHWARWQDPFPKPCYCSPSSQLSSSVEREQSHAADGKDQLAIYVSTASWTVRTRHGRAQESDAMGRADLRAGMRSGSIHDCRRRRLQHGGDGEQGAEHLQHQIRAGPAATLPPMSITQHRPRGGHEYFHNWTGNRVTCRDWFQLSLKEGLTVFRDQDYMAGRRATARWRASRRARPACVQFPEEPAPWRTRSPGRLPEINNFYTATVYEKGAEVVRMMQTLVGEPLPARHGPVLRAPRRTGGDLRRFVAAMADAPGVDLEQFKRWYDQAGSPRIRATGKLLMQ